MILKKGFTLIAIAGFTYACSAPQAPVKQAVVAPSASVAVSQEPIVMQVGNKAITNTEFLQIYKKNLMAGDSSSAERSVKEYAELYSNFKLKVLAAEKQGRDTTTAFREELAMYRQQLAQSYLSEKNVTENLIKEVYDRLKEEVNASHILLSCLPYVSPDDTLKVYNKLIEIRDKALAGEDFGQLAKSYSQDPSAAQNAGNLGFFTALQMVYPFENTAYLTPKGKISMPVRTRFGYHLIKVNDRRTSRGKIKVAHIMTRVKANATTDDQLEAKKKIEEIFKLLEKGEKFEEVCKKYSEDPTSKQSKGELPMFGTGMMAQTFEEAAFSLTDIGEISRPVQTQYGWHILKLIEKKGLESYPDMQGFLRQKVEADARSNVSKSSLVQRLKKDNNFIENTETVKEASMSIDS
jgi:peptidyl-prolyl cis-trans isomerase SurA